MSLMQAMLALTNANRQLDLSLASDLPGGSGIDLALIIGEPPAQSPLIAVTDDQDVIVRTPQVRLRLCAKIVTPLAQVERSEENTSELQSLLRLSYAAFILS